MVHHFLEENLHRFSDIAWVSAKQEEYLNEGGIQSTGKPALDPHALVDQLLIQLIDGPYPTDSYDAKESSLSDALHQKPTLVVIDNLETVDDYKALLPILRKLARPSKFLLTSRMSLRAESDVRCHSLTELSLEDTLAFLKFEIEQQEILSLRHAKKSRLAEIHKTVGGNPLALKLVLGQTHLVSLDTVLANIARAETSSAEQLYQYIYWQAWEMLDEDGRQLWISMPLVPNGTFEQLAVASRLKPAACQQALTALRRLSLIEIGEIGEDQAVRYRIHRLTETFLLHEVVKWRTSSSEQAAVNDAKTLFESQIANALDHWRADRALQQLDVAELDQEKESILTAIRFGLDYQPAWPAVKPLISALTGYMERRGHWDEWLQLLERAMLVAQQQDDTRGEIEITNLRGRLLHRHSKQDELIHNYRRAIRIARRAGNEIEQARACSNLGFTFINLYRWWRAETLCCNALEIFLKHAHSHGQAHTHNHLGILYTRTYRWPDAEGHLREACHIWQGMGDKHGLIYGFINLGQLYNWKGEAERAIDHLERAKALIDETEDYGDMPTVLLNLSVAWALNTQFERAKAYAVEAEALFKERQNDSGLYQVWDAFGSIYRDSGDWAEAQKYFEAALNGFRRTKNLEGELLIYTNRLVYFKKAKLEPEAEKEFKKIEYLVRSNEMLTYSSVYVKAKKIVTVQVWPH